MSFLTVATVVVTIVAADIVGVVAHVRHARRVRMSKLTIVAIAVALVGCGEKVDRSFEAVSLNKGIAKENATYLANKFRASSARYADYNLIIDGDSTISKKCPQGDGWASGKLEDPKTYATIGIKCPTYDPNAQCWFDSDFKKKPFAVQNNTCNPEVPHPIPRIKK